MSDTETVTVGLSHGARTFLLHIARIRPMQKPFPSEPDGRRYLAELIFRDLIVSETPGAFYPTPMGHEAAHILAHCETCNDTGHHPADGMSRACPDCAVQTERTKQDTGTGDK